MKALALLLVTTLLISSLAADPKWIPLDDLKPEDDHAFSFKIALKPQNLDTLDHLYWQITDYHSPLFGQHLSNEQIRELISLPEDDIQAVETYLKSTTGKFCDIFVTRTVHHDYLQVETCAAQARLILPNLNLRVYQKETTGELVLRDARIVDPAQNAALLGLPFDLHQYIDGVHDVTDLPPHYTHSAASFDPKSEDPKNAYAENTKEMTVGDMIDLFGIHFDGIDASTLAADNGQVRQGVIEFGHSSFSATSLAKFQKEYNRPSNAIKRVVGTEEVKGANEVEANLDVQTITAISGNVETWDFVFGSVSYSDIVNTIMATEGAPKVLSCSWTSWEYGYPKSLAQAASTALMKFGLGGFTFLISSGDFGPRWDQGCNHYDPAFPTTSPYVVAVGGTTFNSDLNEQVAWMHSGGGFSEIFPRPAFQDSVVSNYLSSTKLPWGEGTYGYYATTGRAVPDVSAIGAYEPLLMNGVAYTAYGTSGSCPQFAAIVALINIHRYQKGLPALGGLTKTLYQLKNGIGFDVTQGMTWVTNPNSCANHGAYGFYAGEGWDAATGLGAPVFDTLLDQLLNVPGEKIARQ